MSPVRAYARGCGPGTSSSELAAFVPAALPPFFEARLQRLFLNARLGLLGRGLTRTRGQCEPCAEQHEDEPGDTESDADDDAAALDDDAGDEQTQADHDEHSGTYGAD